MNLKGTPYYDMARDAGASEGQEAEQMAQMIYEDHQASGTTWLDDIEEYIQNQPFSYGYRSKMTRMARVIRELVRFIVVLRSTNDQQEIAIAYEDICSVDAKEVIDECVKSL